VALGHVGNARVVESLEAEPPASFDLIIVNSVVQYMPPEELRGWMRVWRRLLRGRGRLVISDMPPAYAQTHRDLFDQIVFSVRRGIFVSTVRHLFTDILRYLPSRQARPLRRFTREEIEALGAESGFAVRILPRNLTCRSARLSATFVAAQTGSQAA
jgi:hypothetical protein